MRVLALALVLTACFGPPGASPGTTPATPATEADARALIRVLDQVDEVLADAEANHELFSRPPDKPLTPDEKARLLSLFAPVVDEVVVLDGVRRQFKPAAKAAEDGGHSFALVFAAHASELAASLAIVGRVTGKDAFETVLNEEQPDFGLGAGLLDRMQAYDLDSNSVDALEKALPRLQELMPRLASVPTPNDDLWLQLARRGMATGEAVRKFIDRQGLKLELKDDVQSLEDLLTNAILPAQTAIATWMGDTKYFRFSRFGLITEEQVTALVAKMQPGDIVTERRNWFVSNIGLPGFWPHAELYTGTKDELAQAFDGDAEIRAEYGGAFTDALAARYPEAWAKYTEAAEDGKPRRIAEAVSEGVVFNSPYESLRADYLGVMRPRLPALAKTHAIERAFKSFAKPYDFEFDFATDASLVCSELVFKSYQQTSQQGPSLAIPLATVLGRFTLPPSDLVKALDKGVDSPEGQLDFVAFLDGNEDQQVAVEKPLEAYRKTWNRTKWDFLQK